MLEIQIQFAIAFELFKLRSWGLKLASALRRSLKWLKTQKLIFLVDLNGVPLKKIGNLGIFVKRIVGKISNEFILLSFFLSYWCRPRPLQPGLSRPRCWIMLWRRSRPPQSALGPLGPLRLSSSWITLLTGMGGTCLHWR